MERDDAVDDEGVRAPLLTYHHGTPGRYAEDERARSPSPQRLRVPHQVDPVDGQGSSRVPGGEGRSETPDASGTTEPRTWAGHLSPTHAGAPRRQQAQVYHPAVGWHVPVAGGTGGWVPRRSRGGGGVTGGLGVGGDGGVGKARAKMAGAKMAGAAKAEPGAEGGGGPRPLQAGLAVGGVLTGKMPASRAAAVAKAVPTGTTATAAALSARARPNTLGQQQKQKHPVGGAVAGDKAGQSSRHGGVSPAARRRSQAIRADMPLPSAFLSPQQPPQQEHYHPAVGWHVPIEGKIMYPRMSMEGSGSSERWGIPEASPLAVVQPAAEEVEGTPLPTIVDPEEGDHADRISSGDSQSSNPLLAAEEDEVIRGRIVIFCTAEKLDRVGLKEQLLKADSSPLGPQHLLGGLRMQTGNPDGAPATVGDGQALTWSDDVLHVPFSPHPETGAFRDIFFFEYGMTVMWGLTKIEETTVLKNVVEKCGVGPFDSSDIEHDEFEFQCEPKAQPRMANDTIVLTTSMMGSAQVKLAISYALAQSTKLSFFEERIQQHSEETMEMPATLARMGRVNMNRKDISKLIGRVFLEKCAANLLYSALDRPEFFWDAPDALQDLYDAICEYLEVDTRLETLNARFEVLQATLDVLRDHQNNEHSSYLEWIVIILIIIEIAIGVVEIAGIVGWVGHEKS